MNYLSVALIALLCSLCSCATIFDGSRQDILVNTYPARAKVQQAGVFLGTTPVIVSIKRKSTDPLILTSEGYETKEIQLTRQFNITSAFNFLNVYGWLIDALSGSMQRFRETSCIQSLKATEELNVVRKVQKLEYPTLSNSVYYWQKWEKLTTDDFKGARDNYFKIFAAATFTTINCQYTLNDTCASVRILTCFYPKESFFKTKKEDVDYVLNHEQQHYNLTEIVSRKLRQQVKSGNFQRATFEKQLNTMVFDSIQEMYAMQANYDHEAYGMGYTSELWEQKQWNKKVAQQLMETNEYKGSDVLVSFAQTGQ